MAHATLVSHGTNVYGSPLCAVHHSLLRGEKAAKDTVPGLRSVEPTEPGKQRHDDLEPNALVFS